MACKKRANVRSYNGDKWVRGGEDSGNHAGVDLKRLLACKGIPEDRTTELVCFLANRRSVQVFRDRLCSIVSLVTILRRGALQKGAQK
jgi:hypothetical protein